MSTYLYNTPLDATPASILTVGELITILQTVPADMKIAQDNDPNMCGNYYVTDITLSNGRVCFDHCSSSDAADVEEMAVTGKWTKTKGTVVTRGSVEKEETLVFNENTNPAVLLTVKSFLEILSTVPVTAKVALWNEPDMYNLCYTCSMTIKNDLLVLSPYGDRDAADVDETDRTGHWLEEDDEDD